ncbi:M4 family metallopeptidase [Jiulongibacter sediminis]|uniref:M4 family metallopeptidase n=1 Tax=Jiulongibacter sediminis TaxID=1605367 RepID=UPI0006DC439F|nr:M4 family metallopeptidase [Jiulongibacter sediminis]
MKKIVITILSICIVNIVSAQNVFKGDVKREKGEAKLLKEFRPVSGREMKKGFTTVKPVSGADLHDHPKVNIIRDPETKEIIFIENLKKEAESKGLRKSAKAQAFDFMTSVKNDFGLKEIERELDFIDTQFDSKGLRHTRIQQKFKGVPVYGAEIVVHANDNKVLSMSGRIVSTPSDLSIRPSFPNNTAIEKALNYLADKTIALPVQTEGIQLASGKQVAELTIYRRDGKPVLAYEMTIRPNILERWVIFMDANSGEVIDAYNHTCTFDGIFKTSAKDLNGITRAFRIYETQNTYFLIDPTKEMFDQNNSQLPNSPIGAIWTIDAKNSSIAGEMQLSHVTSADGQTWNATAVSAHHNASECYEYYRNTFGRNSLNNKGGNIVSVINITDEDGQGMDNAYWNGEFMGYGNGNQGFKPLAGALDVAGHEMTHGVIENTARLEYRNQSGALNESFADIFGAMIDRDDWTLGEDVVRASAFPSGALRSLQNPNQGGQRDPGYQPMNMSQYVYLRDIPSEDNGGVHINSGIPNHAYYLFATGSGMTKSKAENIYYHALNNYLTRTSRFVDLRLAVIQSAKDLFGDGIEANAARAAFDAVGIADPGTGQQTPTEEEQEIEVNPGAQFVIVYEPPTGNLYRLELGGSAFDLISEGIGCKKKPSVNDKGTEVYFVGDDDIIYGIDLTASQPSPIRISDEAVWENVAISKDGKLLAALTTSQDAKIYVFNFETNQQAAFDLYNPTYTQGISTGEVLFADAFEWDYSGEYLVYDAFNQVNSVFGSYDYWDVGVLHAWNVATNDFGDGQIQKIFTDLEEGDNIGNPAISKTNPNVLAFDYLDGNTNEFSILGLNLNTGDLNLITDNNTIGFPDYTITDSHLAYTTETNVGEVVAAIPLNSNRISAAGQAGRLFEGGEDKFAVFYAQGTRELPTKKAQEISFSAIADQNPGASVNLSASASSGLTVQYTVVSGDATLQGSTLVLGNTPGVVTVQAFQVGNSEFVSGSSEQSFCINPSAPSVTTNGDVVSAVGASMYQWFVNGNEIGGVTSNSQITANRNGSYQAKAATQDGCFSGFSNSVQIQKVLSSRNSNAAEVAIFPNPSEDLIRISIKSGFRFESGQLLSLKGDVLKNIDHPLVQIQDLPSGSYLLKIKTDKGESTQKFVKK